MCPDNETVRTTVRTASHLVSASPTVVYTVCSWLSTTSSQNYIAKCSSLHVWRKLLIQCLAHHSGWCSSSTSSMFASSDFFEKYLEPSRGCEGKHRRPCKTCTLKGKLTLQENPIHFESHFRVFGARWEKVFFRRR